MGLESKGIADNFEEFSKEYDAPIKLKNKIRLNSPHALDVEVIMGPQIMKKLFPNGRSKPDVDSRHTFFFSYRLKDPRNKSKPQQIHFFLDRMKMIEQDPRPIKAASSD